MGKVVELRQRRSGAGGDQSSSGDADDHKTISVEVPEDLDWFIWRPVMKRKATLAELDTHYTLEEVEYLNMAIDLEEKLEARVDAYRAQQ